MGDKDDIGDIDKKAAPYTVVSGFCMGTADVVPGVSGGTMAVALGIYHQLLASITSVNKDSIERLLKLDLRGLFEQVHWRFLVSLLLGVGIGVGLMVKVVKLPHLVQIDSPHRPLVYAIFFGMVLGSAATLSRHLERWTAARGAAAVVGAAAGFAIVNLVPVSTPEHPAFVFLCGAVAICAMLLPGISGSFILLILGKYAYILGALGGLDPVVIVPFLVGCVTGIVLFSRLLKWLMDRWHDAMLAALIGLLVGSLWRIWPYQRFGEPVVVRGKERVLEFAPVLPATVDVTIVVGFIVGLAFVIAIEIYASRRVRGAVKPSADLDVGSEESG